MELLPTPANMAATEQEARAHPGYLIQDIQAWFSRDRQWTLIEDSPVVRKLVDGVSILNLGRGHDMEQVHRLLEKGVFQ